MGRYNPGDKLCCIATRAHQGYMSNHAGKLYEIIEFRPGVGVDNRGIIKITPEPPFAYTTIVDMKYFHQAFIKIKSIKKAPQLCGACTFKSPLH